MINTNSIISFYLQAKSYSQMCLVILFMELIPFNFHSCSVSHFYCSHSFLFDISIISARISSLLVENLIHYFFLLIYEQCINGLNVIKYRLWKKFQILFHECIWGKAWIRTFQFFVPLLVIFILSCPWETLTGKWRKFLFKSHSIQSTQFDIFTPRIVSWLSY